MLEAKNLTVAYGKRTILHGLEFSARPGEFTAVIGPNGSGKTTLLKALTGEIPISGAVRIDEVPLEHFKPHELALKRAVLAQETRFAFPFTVAEVVGLGMAAGLPLPSESQRRERIAEALEAVDLAGFAGRSVHALSGGERQRAQLARVLCQIWEPVGASGARWLFLDEPVSSLDIRHQLVIMDLAADYARRGGGVVAVMHDLNLTAMYADRITLMSGGDVAASGPPDAVFGDNTLAEVFGCPLKVGQIPANQRFVLPQSAATAFSLPS
ncbi:MAG: heme ABC transporter ATP-binding protein [Hoeflea sp.]|uniref:heme ABC transporter ATP-binding protein n=1 Tax=Hoeflea sp. TaxID=1940281 RepID=UPI0032ED49B5